MTEEKTFIHRKNYQNKQIRNSSFMFQDTKIAKSSLNSLRKTIIKVYLKANKNIHLAIIQEKTNTIQILNIIYRVKCFHFNFKNLIR